MRRYADKVFICEDKPEATSISSPFAEQNFNGTNVPATLRSSFVAGIELQPPQPETLISSRTDRDSADTDSAIV